MSRLTNLVSALTDFLAAHAESVREDIRIRELDTYARAYMDAKEDLEAADENIIYGYYTEDDDDG